MFLYVMIISGLKTSRLIFHYMMQERDIRRQFEKFLFWAKIKKIYSKVKVIYYLKYSGTDNGLTFTSPNWETSPRLESVSMKILTWHKTSIFFDLILNFMFSLTLSFQSSNFRNHKCVTPTSCCIILLSRFIQTAYNSEIFI